jgi:hypothetical protein
LHGAIFPGSQKVGGSTLSIGRNNLLLAIWSVPATLSVPMERQTTVIDIRSGGKSRARRSVAIGETAKKTGAPARKTLPIGKFAPRVAASGASAEMGLLNRAIEKIIGRACRMRRVAAYIAGVAE